MLNRKVIYLILACTACAALSWSAEGGELISTQLPSERMGYFRTQIVPSQQEMQQPQTDTQKFSKQFYKGYAQKYRGLKKQDMDELLHALSEKQNAAERNSDGDKVLHYLRLQQALKGELK